MNAGHNTRSTAVYWDAENIVARHYETVHGKGSWLRSRTELAQDRPQQRLMLSQAKIDVAAVMNAAVPTGHVVVARAYGDWTRPWGRDLMGDFARVGIDLVQLPSLAGTKNGADMRLAVDAVDDLHDRTQITDVVVVAGDADFSALVTRAQRAGKRVTTVASSSGCSRHLGQLSDEHLVYEELLSAPVVSAPRTDLTSLVLTAVSELLASSPSGWVQGAALRPRLRQLDPTFDIPAGTSMRELVEPLIGTALERRKGEHDHEFRLVTLDSAAGASCPPGPAATMAA